MERKKFPIWAIILIVIGLIFFGYKVIPTLVTYQVVSDAISTTQENANKRTIQHYVRHIQTQYVIAKMHNDLDWVDDQGKIDFSKMPDNTVETVTCTGDSYIDTQSNVTLKDCKVKDYKRIYHYENNQVILDKDK